jgi:hypothetical protein
VIIDSPTCFWSYTHNDDALDGGRVLRLAQAVKDEFSLLTGEELSMFVDRDHLQWGDKFRSTLNGALQETAFFIPIVTPRYFKSTECRLELLKFSGAARALGVVELILPIYYLDVSEMSEESTDECVGLIASMHRADWRDLRLSDEGSEIHRRAVNTLAKRLVDLAEVVGARPASTVAALATGPSTPAQSATDGADSDDAEDDSPGLLDQVATFDDAAGDWTATLTEISAAIVDFNGPMMAASAEINEANAHGKPLAARLALLRQLAISIDEPTRRLEALGAKYVSGALAFDPAIRAAIELAGQAATPEDRQAGSELMNNIRQMIEQSRTGVGSLSAMADSARPIRKLSRDMRPAIRRIEAGVQSLVDAQGLLEEWDRLARESGL